MSKEDKYPMGTTQQAQIDCRAVDCSWHKNGRCMNVAPAITLNAPSSTFVCWSRTTDKVYMKITQITFPEVIGRDEALKKFVDEEVKRAADGYPFEMHSGFRQDSFVVHVLTYTFDDGKG